MLAIDILRRRPATAGGGGGGTGALTLNPDSYSAFANAPGTASCAVSFNGDGTMGIEGDSGTGYLWRDGGTSEGLQIRFVPSAGNLSTANANVWLDLPAGVTFGVTRTTAGNKYCAGSISIRQSSDGAVLAGPVAVDFTAFVEFSGGGLE